MHKVTPRCVATNLKFLNIISGEERDFSAKTALILAACKILSIRATEVKKYREISSEAQSFEADICIKGSTLII